MALPEQWDGMESLSELRLQDNQLEQLPKGLCCGVLSSKLCALNVANNNLKVLRPYFCSLVNLAFLKLDHNELQTLPQRIGVLCRLRTLSVTSNKLKTLPASFAELRLDSLDLYGNEFLNDGPTSAIDKLGFPSLLEIAARTIVEHK